MQNEKKTKWHLFQVLFERTPLVFIKKITIEYIFIVHLFSFRNNVTIYIKSDQTNTEHI
jgi:hypothetical protein